MEPEALLQQRLIEVGATLVRAGGPRELAAVISHWSQGRTVVADHPWLRAASACLGSAGPQLQGAGPGSALAPLEVETLISVGLGAIPDTGTVLLAAAEPSTWRLTLAAPRLMVVIPEPQAGLSLKEALEITAAASGSVSWLTGPSRTADIEKVLVLGAQGPRDLIVVIYQDSQVP